MSEKAMGSYLSFVNDELFPYLKNLGEKPGATNKQKVTSEIIRNKEKTIIASETNMQNALDKVHELTEATISDQHIFPISQAFEGLLPSLGEKKNDGGQFFTPREKLKEKGADALSDIELIAIILGSGNKGQDVMTISSNIAKLIADNNGKISLDTLSNVDGVGLAKAGQILAGFELARRYIVKESIKVSGVKEVLPLINDIMNKQQEYFVCISLNGANEVIEKRIVTVGLLDKSQVHPEKYSLTLSLIGQLL